MCTAAGGIMPITSLDAKPVHGGEISPLTMKIGGEYWRMHWDPAYSYAVDYEGVKTKAFNGTNGHTNGVNGH